ncbi:DNA replication factor Cdt1-like [Octopus sinensis]|uniref:DNA replication factor Cdt1-like n=1 Tax=Octopus sinensis TaxID=2607531 RepID=A0A6P7U282_9MOLL|nr:DNA replication factor Cdt1-like [Octopus sinensis]
MSRITNYFEPKKATIKRGIKDEKEDIICSASKRQKFEQSTPTSPQPPTLSEKYRHLLIPNPTLSLPSKYNLLKSLFDATEMIVSILHNRKEDCYFDKLVPSVERLTRK